MVKKLFTMFQFDYCPRHWWDLIWFYNNGIGPPEEEAQVRPFDGILWRILFYITCLPCCYPCYLSRSVREAEGHEALDEANLPTVESGVHEALYRMVAATKELETDMDPTTKHDMIEVSTS